MTINELIKVLCEAKKQYGNVPVILSADTEGNGFGTLDKQTSLCPVLDETETEVIGLCLFPFIEHCYDMQEAIYEHNKRK